MRALLSYKAKGVSLRLIGQEICFLIGRTKKKSGGVRVEKILSMKIHISKRKRGFTLIEMIVVIAIIAVIIAIVAPMMLRYIESADDVKYNAAAKNLYTAAQAYVAEVVGHPERATGTANSLDKDGNGFFSNAPGFGVNPLDEFVDGEIPNGLAYCVSVKNYGVVGAALMDGVNWKTYVYPNNVDFDDIWVGDHPGRPKP